MEESQEAFLRYAKDLSLLRLQKVGQLRGFNARGGCELRDADRGLRLKEG